MSSYPRQSILFISGLEKSITESNLYSLFNEFPITYVKIAKDHNTRESFGYAFIGFKFHHKGKLKFLQNSKKKMKMK
jgi:RNA recognition motif-containing protein